MTHRALGVRETFAATPRLFTQEPYRDPRAEPLAFRT